MKAKIRFGLIAILLFSCTPQQRLARLLKQHPELVKTDTVFRTDTIHTGEVRSDTAFLFSHSRDTVVVDRGRLQMKYYYSHDTVFLSGKCRDSVIIKQYPVEVTTYKQEEKKGKAAWYEVNWWKIAAFLLLIALIFHILRK